jgi:hypothetical protein
MVGESKALDPRKYFIVTFALFSNGEVRFTIFFIEINNQYRDYLQSSSPSNTVIVA